MPSTPGSSLASSANPDAWSFLVDENLPRLLAPRLRATGYQAQDVREVGLGTHPDADVWHYAQAQTRTLITQDGATLPTSAPIQHPTRVS
jgi:predicted nuclease of predicted toxin-antitoxin system